MVFRHVIDLIQYDLTYHLFYIKLNKISGNDRKRDILVIDQIILLID